MNYAWISPHGEWLTYSEHTTHTGRHKRLGTTSNLSQAYVGSAIPEYNESQGVALLSFIPIPAVCTVVRTVVLGELASKGTE